MRASLTRTIAAGLAALTLGAGTLAVTSPASAAMWRGGAVHAGGWGGNWHGGWGGGWHGGWRGWGWAPFAAGAVAGAALSAPYYYGGYYGYNACVTYQPMYDEWGNYIGQQAVNSC